MSRRVRRVLPLALPLVFCLALTACGDDDSGDGSDSGPARSSSVKVEGEVGTDPEVTWDGDFEVDKVTSEVITEGDGEEIKSGDTVMADYWLGNGYTQEQVFSTYDRRRPSCSIVEDGTLSPVFLEAARGPDHRLPRGGGRVRGGGLRPRAATPSSTSATRTPCVVVVDLLSKVADGPEGAEKPAPAWAPKIVEKDGVPTSFDFTGTPKPDAADAVGDPHRGHRRRPSRRARPSPSTTSARSTRARSRSTRATARASRRRSRSAPAASSRAGTRRWSA